MSHLMIDESLFLTSTKNDLYILSINFTQATFRQADEFREALESIISCGGKNIILDFSRCEYLDSIFLGIMVSTLKAVRENGGDIRVVYEGNIVWTIFEVSRTNKVIQLYQTLEAAETSFQ